MTTCQPWFTSPADLIETSPYMTADPRGPQRYVQLFQSIPALERVYFRFEKDFNVKDVYIWMYLKPWVPILAVILYLSFLIEGKRFIDNRRRQGQKPINLGFIPAAWNLFLAVFSAWGALRLVPHLLLLFTYLDFKGTLCTRPDKAGYGDGAAGLWAAAFALSKLFELFDTVILVLRGKEPMFLHWYHHVTVLLYTWFAYTNRHTGIYFMAMNFSVHAIMYTYYFLMEMRWWPKWLNPMFITIMQISQMFVGVGVTIAGFAYTRGTLAHTCEGIATHTLPYCGAMYGTYLYFFVAFFVERFLRNNKKTKSPSAEKSSSPKVTKSTQQKEEKVSTKPSPMRGLDSIRSDTAVAATVPTNAPQSGVCVQL